MKDPPPPTCTGSFSRSMGLPCTHILKSLQEQQQVLQLQHFHSHWYLIREGNPQLLLEPRRRIDPISSRIPLSSTRREPSGFEVVEAVTRAVPRCSNCHVLGHTMRSKICPLRYSELLTGNRASSRASSRAGQQGQLQGQLQGWQQGQLQGWQQGWQQGQLQGQQQGQSQKSLSFRPLQQDAH